MKNKPLSDSFRQLINLLNDGGWHSGDALGEKLGVSRAAVWKLMTQLKSHGIAVNTHKTTGYQLVDPLYLIDDSAIRQQLKFEHESLQFDLFESIPSTNDYLMLYPSSDEDKSVVCASEMQTKGKGRLGRVWQSPFAQNIYLSYLWLFNQDVSALMGLSLVVSIAMTKALEKIGMTNLKIKWPNDIYADGKKLSGILIEIKAESNGRSRVVIGSGVNVNMLSDDGIDQPYSSCAQMLSRQVNRNDLIAAYLNELTAALNCFAKEGLSPFLDIWDQYDYLRGRSITLLHNKVKHHGEVKGINETGSLLLNTGDQIQAFSAGDTSIQK